MMPAQMFPAGGVIADDLTGANATGALLTTAGLRVVSLLDTPVIAPEIWYRELPAAREKIDCLIINTGSRNLPEWQARQAVRRAAAFLKDLRVKYFAKRIDSTLRGNVGAETEELLEQLGDDWTAVVVPAFPTSGRTTVDGVQFVHGRPLLETEAARDPVSGLRSSRVREVIAEQSRLPLAEIMLSTVRQGEIAVTTRLQELMRTARLVVVDAVTDSDINIIARAVVAAGIKALAVDPGPFCQQLFTLTFNRQRQQKRAKVLVVAGSATDLTRRQLFELEKERNARFLTLMVEQILTAEPDQEWLEKTAARICSLSAEADVFGLRTVGEKEGTVDLEQWALRLGEHKNVLARRITTVMARLAVKVALAVYPQLHGIYITGGDMLAAFCREAGASAIKIEAEVMPLTAYGRLLDGPLNGLPVVTKGGLVGDERGAVRCINYLLDCRQASSLLPGR